MSYLSVLCTDLYQYLQRFVLHRYVPPHFSLQDARLLCILDNRINSISTVYSVATVKTHEYRYIVDIDEPGVHTKERIYTQYHQCEALFNRNMYVAYITARRVVVFDFDDNKMYDEPHTDVCTIVFYRNLLLIATLTHLEAVDFMTGETEICYEFTSVDRTHRMCMSLGTPVFWRGIRVEYGAELRCLVENQCVHDIDTDDEGKVLILLLNTIEVFDSDCSHLFSYKLGGFYFQKLRIIDHRALVVRFGSQLWQFCII